MLENVPPVYGAKSIENNPVKLIQNCSDLRELSEVLNSFGALVNDEAFLSEEDIKKSSELARLATLAIQKDAIDLYLNRQNEMPENFGIRAKYVELLNNKFRMHL